MKTHPKDIDELVEIAVLKLLGCKRCEVESRLLFIDRALIPSWSWRWSGSPACEAAWEIATSFSSNSDMLSVTIHEIRGRNTYFEMKSSLMPCSGSLYT